MRTFQLGEIVVRLGGGRLAKEDTIDPAVGLVVGRRIGDRIAAGEALAEVHMTRRDDALVERVRDCFVIGEAPAAAPALVVDRID